MPDATRACLLTPPGAGAIAVIRISGPRAGPIVADLFRPLAGGPLPEFTNRLVYGMVIVDESPIDEVLAGAAAGSDKAIDLCCHGGIRIVERILQALSRCGAEPVERNQEHQVPWPVDTLVQAEAVRALAETRTEAGARFLARQYVELPERIRRIVSACREDGIAAEQLLRDTLDGCTRARYLLAGATVAIIGSPNAGKSTLFNRLTGRTSAVVSPLDGTTRDWLSEWTELGGVPVRLIDTAGARDPSNELEAAAIERGSDFSTGADLRLVMMDASAPPPEAVVRRVRAWLTPGPCILVLNKIDLGDAAGVERAVASADAPVCRVSALTGEGLDSVEAAIQRCFGSDAERSPGPTAFTTRQVAACRRAEGLLPRDAVAAARILQTELLGITP